MPSNRVQLKVYNRLCLYLKCLKRATEKNNSHIEHPPKIAQQQHNKKRDPKNVAINGAIEAFQSHFRN